MRFNWYKPLEEREHYHSNTGEYMGWITYYAPHPDEFDGTPGWKGGWKVLIKRKIKGLSADLGHDFNVELPQSLDAAKNVADEIANRLMTL